MPVSAENFFSTTTLIDGFKEIPPSESFLNSSFFGEVKFFDGRFCAVDTKRARRILAPVAKRGQLGRAIIRPPVATSFYDVPIIAPIRVSTVADLDERGFGEHIFQTRSATDRLAEQAVDDYAELEAAISRRIELMTSQLLLTGTISYVLDDGVTVETLEYGKPTVTLTVVPWDSPDADPIADLARAHNLIVAQTGFHADLAIFGEKTLEAFLSNRKVRETLNLLQFKLGTIEPRPAEGNAQWIGRLLRPSVDLYDYAETYDDELTGAVTPMVPDDVVIFGASEAGGRTAYGSINQMETDGQVRSYHDLRVVPLYLSTPNEQERKFRLASRPCLIPSDLLSWGIIKPLASSEEPEESATPEESETRTQNLK